MKNTQKSFIIISSITLLLFLVLAALLYYYPANFKKEGNAVLRNSPDKNFQKIKVGSAVINAQMLTTEPEWILGLSGRDSLATSTGMLFVFDKPGYWSIWMKDMKFPIDVIWITQDMKVSDIVEDMKVESYPASYKPRVPAKYVLEVPTGTVKINNIKAGQALEILR